MRLAIDQFQRGYFGSTALVLLFTALLLAPAIWLAISSFVPLRLARIPTLEFSDQAVICRELDTDKTVSVPYSDIESVVLTESFGRSGPIGYDKLVITPEGSGSSICIYPSFDKPVNLVMAQFEKHCTALRRNGRGDWKQLYRSEPAANSITVRSKGINLERIGLWYRMLRLFILFGWCGVIPLFLVWQWSTTLELTQDHWSQKAFFISSMVFVGTLFFTLLRNSVSRTNFLLGLIPDDSKMSTYRGWKLVMILTILYGIVGVLIGFGYAMTMDLVLRFIPRSVSAEIPGVYSHRIWVRGEIRVITTDYGDIEIHTTGVHKKIDMPKELISGEPLLLVGHKNDHVFVLDSVTKQKAR